jgi:hypothetical protein
MGPGARQQDFQVYLQNLKSRPGRVSCICSSPHSAPARSDRPCPVGLVGTLFSSECQFDAQQPGSDFDSESLQLALFPNSSSLECSLTCHFRRRFKITVRGPATNSRATVGRLAVGSAAALPARAELRVASAAPRVAKFRRKGNVPLGYQPRTPIPIKTLGYAIRVASNQWSKVGILSQVSTANHTPPPAM